VPTTASASRSGHRPQGDGPRPAARPNAMSTMRAEETSGAGSQYPPTLGIRPRPTTAFRQSPPSRAELDAWPSADRYPATTPPSAPPDPREGRRPLCEQVGPHVAGPLFPIFTAAPLPTRPVDRAGVAGHHDRTPHHEETRGAAAPPVPVQLRATGRGQHGGGCFGEDGIPEALQRGNARGCGS